jgi:hypothetical protein
MTYRGHIRNGWITLDNPTPLPEGAAVKVEVLGSGDNDQSGQARENLNALLRRHAGKGRDLPPDLATHHDHYAHGKPKR